MSCGYACIRCGKCQGKARPLQAVTRCPRCGQRVTADDGRCPSCGMALPRMPGVPDAGRIS